MFAFNPTYDDTIHLAGLAIHEIAVDGANAKKSVITEAILGSPEIIQEIIRERDTVIQHVNRVIMFANGYWTECLSDEIATSCAKTIAKLNDVINKSREDPHLMPDDEFTLYRAAFMLYNRHHIFTHLVNIIKLSYIEKNPMLRAEIRQNLKILFAGFLANSHLLGIIDYDEYIQYTSIDDIKDFIEISWNTANPNTLTMAILSYCAIVVHRIPNCETEDITSVVNDVCNNQGVRRKEDRDDIAFITKAILDSADNDHTRIVYVSHWISDLVLRDNATLLNFLGVFAILLHKIFYSPECLLYIDM